MNINKNTLDMITARSTRWRRKWRTKLRWSL